MRILLVEDEKRMAQALCEILRLEKYKVDHYVNGLDGLAALESNMYDIAILDVMLPQMNGFEITKKARSNGIATPILMLTAKAELDDKVNGLDCGADDYLTKPFQMLELAARVEAVLRRTKKVESEFTMGELKCDFNRHQVFLNGTVVECTPKEYELLEVLIRNRNIALSREKLLDMVWGYDFDGGTRTVDVHIQRLRHKLHLENQIRTVYKLGYRLEVHK